VRGWTRAVLILGGAAAFALGFWTTQLRSERGARAAAPQQSARRAIAPASRSYLPAEPRPQPSSASAETPGPAPARSSAEDHGLSAELLPALALYRESPLPDEREDALFEIALSDDPRVLGFLLEELRASDGAARLHVIEALVQYASPAALPALRGLLGRSADADEQAALEQAIEDLSQSDAPERSRGRESLHDRLPVLERAEPRLDAQSARTH
jgi:hypothetical protein